MKQWLSIERACGNRISKQDLLAEGQAVCCPVVALRVEAEKHAGSSSSPGDPGHLFGEEARVKAVWEEVPWGSDIEHHRVHAGRSGPAIGPTLAAGPFQHPPDIYPILSDSEEDDRAYGARGPDPLFCLGPVGPGQGLGGRRRLDPEVESPGADGRRRPLHHCPAPGASPLGECHFISAQRDDGGGEVAERRGQGQVGGEQDLGVCHIFNQQRGGKLKLSNAPSEGLAEFKQFLSYCKMGPIFNSWAV